MNVPIVKRQSTLLRKLVEESGDVKEFIEVGCGEGHNLELLSGMGLKGAGIDFSGEAINLAEKKKLENIKLINQDFHEVNLKNKDLLLLLFVLEHIEDDVKALKKINSFLARGGHMIISVPAHSNLYSRQDRLAGHYRRYDRKELIDKLQDAGFKVKKILSFGFPVSNIYLRLYNLVLYLTKRGDELVVEHTPDTGIKSKQKHIPLTFRLISGIAFPILTLLVPLDYPFLGTDLGTHYIILAVKS